MKLEAIIRAHNSTYQLTGAIMSTRSRASFVCLLSNSNHQHHGSARRRGAAVPCARASQPTTWRRTLPTAAVNTNPDIP